MQTTTKEASLYYREGSSDKVYHATVEPEGDKFVVNFQYGRRGGNMTTGTKTSSPVTLDQAVKVWNQLVNSKLSKGYRHMTETEGSIPQADPPETPTESECVLLNPVDEEEANRLIGDKSWAVQPKFDGVRFMLGMKDNKVYALNRKGKRVSVPNNVAKDAVNIGDEFLLDGELVGDRLYVFDVLEYGECVRGMALEERSKLLFNMTSTLRASSGDKSSILFVALTTGSKEKERLVNSLLLNRGEGVVFKKLGSAYNVGRPASGGNYLKFKFYSTATCLVAKVNQKRSVSLVMGCGTEVGNVTIPPNHDVPAKGDTVEVRYLYAYREGSLYQPTYLGKRDDVGPDLAESLKLKGDDE